MPPGISCLATIKLSLWDKTQSLLRGKLLIFALGSLISVLPLLVAFIVLGKYWHRGLIAGAIEG
jgi:multiple sugar transport system permease protein